MWSPGMSRPRGRTMRSEARSGVLGWKFCASTAAAPPLREVGGGETGSLWLELWQVGGELDHLREAGMVGLTAFRVDPVQEPDLLAAVTAGAG